MNNFNKASRYVYFLLTVELIIIALLFIVINYAVNSWNAELASVSTMIFAIETIGNFLFILAVIKLYRLFPKDFMKSIISALAIILLSILAFIFDKQLESNDSIMLIAVLTAAIARMLCYYFMLSSFHDICMDMKNEYLAKQFKACRTLYMIGIILNAATNNNFMGEQLTNIFMALYQAVNVYVLIMYSRLGKALKMYREPKDNEAEQA